MWWNSRKEMRVWMHLVSDRLESLEDNVRLIYESDSIDRLHDKLNSLLKDEDREEEVRLAIMTLDKFDEYMKNVDKLNAMVNEFKGCVAICRGLCKTQEKKSPKKAKTQPKTVKKPAPAPQPQ
jgi:hypothetical protein